MINADYKLLWEALLRNLKEEVDSEVFNNYNFSKENTHEEILKYGESERKQGKISIYYEMIQMKVDHMKNLLKN